MSCSSHSCVPAQVRDRSSVRRVLARFGRRVTRDQAPPAVAPRREGVMLVAQIWHRVEAVAAPRMAAAESRQREPAALPCPVRVDGLARIVRAGRQMPAIDPEQRRDGQAIKRRSAQAAAPWRSARRTARSPRRARAGVLDMLGANAAPWRARLASIWPIASSTASNTSSVEACRALVVAHRLEHGEIGPFAVRRRAALLSASCASPRRPPAARRRSSRRPRAPSPRPTTGRAGRPSRFGRSRSPRRRPWRDRP